MPVLQIQHMFFPMCKKLDDVDFGDALFLTVISISLFKKISKTLSHHVKKDEPVEKVGYILPGFIFWTINPP